MQATLRWTFWASSAASVAVSCVTHALMLLYEPPNCCSMHAHLVRRGPIQARAADILQALHTLLQPIAFAVLQRHGRCCCCCRWRVCLSVAGSCTVARRALLLPPRVNYRAAGLRMAGHAPRTSGLPERPSRALYLLCITVVFCCAPIDLVTGCCKRPLRASGRAAGTPSMSKG